MASSHNASSPTYFSTGRVDSLAWNSLNPKASSTLSTNSSSDASSAAMCSRAQKMWASSWVKPRLRSRPCTAPDSS